MKLDMGTRLDLWDDLIYKLMNSLKDADPCFQEDAHASRLHVEMPRQHVRRSML